MDAEVSGRIEGRMQGPEESGDQRQRQHNGRRHHGVSNAKSAETEHEAVKHQDCGSIKEPLSAAAEPEALRRCGFSNSHRNRAKSNFHF